MENNETESAVERVRNYLCGYQFCVDMLRLRGYERKRARHFDESCDCEDLLLGDELLWRTRMYEIQNLIDSMRNCREKIILYYHYVRGESIEHAADLLGVSRRTGYRLHQKGLLVASIIFERMKKKERLPLE